MFLVMRMSDFDPVLRADLPAVLASLARGDAAPFAHLFLRASDLRRLPTPPRLGLQSDDDGYSVSRFLATACLEAQLPWSPASAPSTREAATDGLPRQARLAPVRPVQAVARQRRRRVARVPQVALDPAPRAAAAPRRRTCPCS